MKILVKIIILATVLLSGCTTYQITPEPNACNEIKQKKIASYSYRISNLNLNDEKFKEVETVTKAVLSDAEFLLKIPNNKNKPHLEIDISPLPYDGSHCGIIFWTSISLGIIPTWCTVEDMYEFEFLTSINGNVIKENKYKIDQFNFAHLVVLPVGLYQMAATPKFEPLSKYENALLTNKYVDCK